jgi:hypothetical protein
MQGHQHEKQTARGVRQTGVLKRGIAGAVAVLTVATCIETAEEPMFPLTLAFRISLEASVEGTTPHAHLLGHARLVDHMLSVRGALLSVGVGHASGLLLLLVHVDGEFKRSR